MRSSYITFQRGNCITPNNSPAAEKPGFHAVCVDQFSDSD